MRFFINIFIIGVIVFLAAVIVYKSFKKEQQGRCAACDLDCPAKKLANNLPKNSVYFKKEIK